MSIGIDFTTTGLIADAQLRAGAPNAQSLFLNADFLRLMTGDMHLFIVPLIKSQNDEYFVTVNDTPLVNNTSSYTIPTRAQGGSLRDVVAVDAQGNESELPRLQPEYIKGGTTYSNNRLFGIYLQDDKVVFFPAISIPQTGMSVRFKYERMPNDLVTTDSSAKITALNAAALQVTVASLPAAWTTSTTLDLIKPDPLFVSYGDDLVISGLSSNTITLGSWPTNIAVGQYLSESRTTPIPQIPYEAHKLLAQRGAIKICETLGDTNGLQNARSAYKEMADNFQLMIAPVSRAHPRRSPIAAGSLTRCKRNRIGEA
jgi:hypothetical protein